LGLLASEPKKTDQGAYDKMTAAELILAVGVRVLVVLVLLGAYVAASMLHAAKFTHSTRKIAAVAVSKIVPICP
jgi:hypothetical protein